MSLTGRYDEAARLSDQALLLDPNNPQVWLWVSSTRRYCGNTEGTLAALRRTVELSPTFGMATMLLGSQEVAVGNAAEGLRYTQIAEHLLRDTVNPVFLAHFVGNYAQLGHRADAERSMARLEAMAETHRIPSAAWIHAYAGLGDEERTLHWLKVAAERPESYVGFFSLQVAKFNPYGSRVLDLPACREARARLPFKD